MKDYAPLNHSQSSEDDGFSQASSRPPSEEELRLAALSTRYKCMLLFLSFKGNKVNELQPWKQSDQESTETLKHLTIWYLISNLQKNTTNNELKFCGAQAWYCTSYSSLPSERINKPHYRLGLHVHKHKHTLWSLFWVNQSQSIQRSATVNTYQSAKSFKIVPNRWTVYWVKLDCNYFAHLLKVYTTSKTSF